MPANMTKEELIAYGKEWLKDEYALNNKDRTFIEAAIKALEKESALYVKTADGYMQGYGSEIYLVGVYDSRDKAEQDGQFGSITEITLNKTYPLTKHVDDVLGYESYENENFLGGYTE